MFYKFISVFLESRKLLSTYCNAVIIIIIAVISDAMILDFTITYVYDYYNTNEIKHYLLLNTIRPFD